jgi:hypothetical protein
MARSSRPLWRGAFGCISLSAIHWGPIWGGVPLDWALCGDHLMGGRLGGALGGPLVGAPEGSRTVSQWETALGGIFGVQ